MKNFLTFSLVFIYLVAWLPVAAVTKAQVTCGSGSTPACLYFNPASGNVNVSNSNITVDVMFNTGGQNSMGADVWVQFQTAQMSFVSGTYPDGNDSSGHPVYPMKVIDPITADSSGVIKMTRLINLSNNPVYTNGTGTFARLTFRPTGAIGSTVNLSFVYTAGMGGGDSSIAGTQAGADILGAATPATLTLASGGGNQQTGVLDHVSINPTSATLSLNGTQAFTATAYDSSNAAITSGITYAWTEVGNGAVNPAAGSTTTYTAGASAETATVTITASQTSGTSTITKTANATVTVGGTFNPGQITGAGPYITAISPVAGQKDLTPQATIIGGNFGAYDSTKSKVYFGMQEATVLDWSANRIVVRVPAAPDITSRLTVTVRVLTSDDKTAEFLGYTYTLSGGSLPSNGPETYTWAGILMAAIGMAGLAYMALAGKKVASSQPVQLG